MQNFMSLKSIRNNNTKCLKKYLNTIQEIRLSLQHKSGRCPVEDQITSEILTMAEDMLLKTFRNLEKFRGNTAV